MSYKIEAVTVNHSTSDYTELMLRSLYHLNQDEFPNMKLTLVHSLWNDDASQLDAYAAQIGAKITDKPKKFEGPGNSHGEILRQFVLSKPEADYYLFLDADVVFLEEGTIRTMKRELDAEKDIFGVQARLSPDGHKEQEVGSIPIWKEPVYIGWKTGSTPEDVKVGTPTTAMPMKYYMQRRIHPCCALIKNTETFHRVVDLIGLSTGHTSECGGGKGFDTLALMTLVMETHGLSFKLSDKMVIHFVGVSYNRKENKDTLCSQLLFEYRNR